MERNKIKGEAPEIQIVSKSSKEEQEKIRLKSYKMIYSNIKEQINNFS